MATVTDLLDVDPRAALVLADIGTAQFEASGALARHPARAINVGIREQAMVGVAGGFALEGFRSVVHSYATFLVERAFDQVKLDFTHQGTGGVFVSVGASYDASASGRTHHAPGDVALMATLPGVRVHVPGHPEEVERILRREAAAEGCAYVRLAEDANAKPVDAGPSGLIVVREGSSRAVVIAVGPMLDPTLQATRDVDATVLYASTVRPFDGATLRAAVADGGAVVLVEPYLGGTSAGEIAAALEAVPHRLLALGVPKVDLRRYGTRAEHARAHGLDAAGLRARIAPFLDRGRAPVSATV